MSRRLPTDHCSAVLFPEDRLAYVKLPTVVEDHNLTTCTEVLHTDPAWDERFDVVWDFRTVRPLEPEPSDLVARGFVAVSRHREKPVTVARTTGDAAAALGRAALPFG